MLRGLYQAQFFMLEKVKVKLKVNNILFSMTYTIVMNARQNVIFL